jgi:hypothetical protein
VQVNNCPRKALYNLDKNDKLLPMSKNIAHIFFPLICLAFLFFSCSTGPEAYREIDQAVDKNEFDMAVEDLKKGQKRRRPIYPEKNAISLYIDKGLLEHYAGNYAISSQDLQEAERLIQEAFTKSVTADLASYIANDNTKEYPGEDFEDIYINVFNALNYYNRGNIDGALVEIRKLTISNGKLDMLSRKYENARRSRGGNGAAETLRGFGMSPDDAMPRGKPVEFSNSALARYLSALFYLSDGNDDDARIEFEQLQAAFDSNAKVYNHPFPQSAVDLQTVPAEKARLNIISFAGLSPIKEEEQFTVSFPLAYSILCQPVFKLPKFVKRRSAITRIEVVVEGEEGKFDLELLEDMGAVIEETYNARFSQIFYKTFIRLLTKYAAVAVAATAAKERGGDYAELAALSTIIGGKAAADASEGADIRMARYLPDKAYIGGINLDPGTYNITINYYSGSRIIAQDERRDVVVRVNAPNLIETISLK